MKLHHVNGKGDTQCTRTPCDVTDDSSGPQAVLGWRYQKGKILVKLEPNARHVRVKVHYRTVTEGTWTRCSLKGAVTTQRAWKWVHTKVLTTIPRQPPTSKLPIH